MPFLRNAYGFGFSGHRVVSRDARTSRWHKVQILGGMASGECRNVTGNFYIILHFTCKNKNHTDRSMEILQKTKCNCHSFCCFLCV